MQQTSYFTSDWHLGHKNIIGMGGRPFSTIEEMDKTIIDNVLSKVKRGDSLYFLGDLTFNKGLIEPTLKLFKKEGIDFFWIVGNHDYKFPFTKYAHLCKVITPNHIFRSEDSNVTTIIHLNHFPLRIWQRSYANSFHLYGHIHKFSIEKEVIQDIPYGKSLNVNVEFNDFMPYSLEDIVEEMAKRPNNIDYELKKQKDRKKRISELLKEGKKPDDGENVLRDNLYHLGVTDW